MCQAGLDFEPEIAHMLVMAADEIPSDIPSGKESLNPAQIQELRASLQRYFQWRVREAEDIPDLVQDVFVRVLGRVQPGDIENLRSYAFQVAASVLVDRNRRRAVRQHEAHVEFDPSQSGQTEIGPDRIVAGREELRALMALVAQMPERTRTVFVLRRLEHMSYKEIANRLDLSVSAVEKHMVRAAERLARFGELP